MLRLPGESWTKKILFPIEAIQILQGKSMVEELESVDTSREFAFLERFSFDEQAAALLEVAPERLKKALVKKYPSQAAVQQPDLQQEVKREQAQVSTAPHSRRKWKTGVVKVEADEDMALFPPGVLARVKECANEVIDLKTSQ